MPLYKTISTTDGLISVWQLSETTEELLSLFSSDELAEDYRKFNFEKRIAEWLATRALLKHMIGAPFKISYTESGKPLLFHSLYQHISISHSREYVAVYVHKNKAIGIDIESINRNYSPILKKYLSAAELNHVKDSILLQCLYWCAKEALFKLVEEEGIDFRKQFEIIAAEPLQEVLSARFISESQKQIYQLQFTSFSEHCMVWVCN